MNVARAAKFRAMFLGHFALGFAAKPLAPRVSLGWLFVAAQLCDVVWPVLVFAGVERVHIDPCSSDFTPLTFDHYPWSHGLVCVAGWALAAGAVTWSVLRDRSAALIVALLVASHWLLDLVTHVPDMPLGPWSTQRYGFGLWNHFGATLAVEGVLFAAGVAVYARRTRALDRIGSGAFVAFTLVLALLYLAAAFGPPPPDVNALAATMLGGALLFVWAAWFDRHRAAR